MEIHFVLQHYEGQIPRLIYFFQLIILLFFPSIFYVLEKILFYERFVKIITTVRKLT